MSGFADKVVRVFDLIQGAAGSTTGLEESSKHVYWSDQDGVIDLAEYQACFIAVFRKRHNERACDARSTRECIRRMHAPHGENRKCFPLMGEFVVSQDNGRTAVTFSCKTMPWIDSVIFTATGTDIGRAKTTVINHGSMNVFHIPVSERAPFGPCNSLLQPAITPSFRIASPVIDSVNSIENVPENLGIKPLIDSLTGSICVACMAGSNRSTSMLAMYALLSSPLSLNHVLEHFGKFREYQIFDYNMSQLIAIEAHRKHLCLHGGLRHSCNQTVSSETPQIVLVHPVNKPF